MKQKVVLDFDDSTIFQINWDKLDRLKERYPQLKVSFFHIPFDFNAEKSLQKTMRDMAVKRLKSNLDWIQLIPHGVAHLPREFEKANKETCEMALKAIDAFMKDGPSGDTGDNLPYEKGFKAPQWLYNQDLVDVLDKEGWWMGVDRNQPKAPRTKVYYEYNLSIDEKFWESKEPVWKLHGHMGLPSANNIDDCFLNLLKIPLDAEFFYVTDYLTNEDK